jgi:hypothetical protein
MRRGVNDAFTVTRRKLRAAIMASPAGTWDTSSLWDATWWTDAVDKDIAPVLWRIYWSSAQRIADAAGTDVMNARTTIETRWRTQVNRIYGYADTVGNRVGELAVEGDGESRGWMLDRLGLVAAAGPLSDGIESNMTDSESVGAEQGGFDAGGMSGTKMWLATGPNPRPTHQAADGQEVAYGDPFDVGGFEGMYPGDDALPDEERCNCFCSVEYAVDGAPELSFDDLDPEQVDAAQVDDPALGEFGDLSVSGSGDSAEVGVSSASEETQPFVDAVSSTPEYRMLSSIYLDALNGSPPIIAGVELDRAGTLAAMSYLLDPTEVWGRAFAQWSAVETGSTAAESALFAAPGGEGAPMLPLYWAGAAFVPVRDGVRRSLRKAKVLR